MIGQTLEDSLGRRAITPADAIERIRNGRLDRSRAYLVGPAAAWSETKHCASAIAWIIGSCQQPLRDQAPNDSGQRAGVDVKNPGQISCRQTGEQTDDAQDEPLRTGDADFTPHPLRCSFQAVDHGPQQPHELQNIGQGLCRSVLASIGKSTPMI
jgi:hypothetical protein